MADEQNAQEMMDAATSKIADEVMETADAMNQYGKMGGKLASEEEAAAVANPPAPEAGSESQPPESPPVEESFLEKKYGRGNWKEADKGYINLQDKLNQERAQHEQERQQYLQYIQQLQPPMQQQAAPDPLKQLEDVGIPGDPLAALIKSEAAKQVQETLGPLVAEAQAEALLQRRAGYDAQEYQKAYQWAEEDPLLKAQVNTASLEAKTPENRAMIKDYVLMKYRESQGAKVETAIQANAEVREAVVEKTRKDAGIIGAKNAPSRAAIKADDKFIEKDEMDRIKRLAALGYGAKAAGNLLGDSLPDEMFE
jgi:hypothetical protein